MNSQGMRWSAGCFVTVLGAILAGCGGVDAGVSTGGDQTGSLTSGGTSGLGTLTAPYVVLDLETGKFDSRSSIPTLSTDAPFRDRYMVFKRITGSGPDQLMAVFETTQGQWTRIAPAVVQPWASAPAEIVGSTAIAVDRPAFNLSYATIDGSLATWNHQHGSQLHLPTAAQWAYAAGGGSAGPYWWGDQTDRSTLLSRAVVADVTDGVNGPRSVGSVAPNPFGLYDVSGNVWEWIDGGTELRGGSWSDPASAAMTRSVLDTATSGLTDVTEHVLAGARLVFVP